MSDRWVLNRAGILNVYQYEDEVLHFGGGRLLLRGVNGSGKSTAMNMLLPFLLDADTRRIDAAGVQQGVLRSWMLTGRDEQQPVGYLWIELARAEEHLVFGCGIRANRSTDNVSTWWFITDRRPHVDVNLLDGRTPRSIDSLREALGPRSSVFTKEQRSAYRSELRTRLFGGADLDQHIRLLHVLRNPTVGDRIDNDLDRYLDEALPQLSEQAIDDAAQPLEDLEEHRRNVAQLTATDEAIGALATTYSTYVRGELRAAAERAQADVDGVADLRRRADRLARQAAQAATELHEARAVVRSLEDDLVRLGAEIGALKDQPLYQEGKTLEDLRALVATLAEATGRADAQLVEATDRHDAESEHERAAASTASSDHAAVTAALSELRAAITLHRIDAAVADLPSIEVDTAGSPPADVGAVVAAELGAVTAAIALRTGDVDDVRRALGAVEDAVRALRHCEEAAARARAELTDAAGQLIEQEAASADAVSSLRAALDRWTEGARAFAVTVADDVGKPPMLAADADVRGDRVELRSLSVAWIRSFRERIDLEVAQAEVATRTAASAEEEARAALNELMERTEPEPLSLAWQAIDDEPRLAELVDFREEVTHDDRLGLEAALEASGLLAATIRGAELHLADGDLVAVGGPPVARPLSDLLVVTLPALGAHLDAERVRRALDAISIDLDGDAPTAVATDGRFRIGTLHGRHRRDRLELIGVTARRAALERQRDEARSVLEVAEQAHEDARSEHERWTTRREGALELTERLPSTAELDRTLLAEAAAVDLVDRRTDAVREIEDEAARLEDQRDQREDALRRAAASLQLPRTPTELDAVQRDLDAAREQVGRARSVLSTLDRSLAAWATARDRLVAARADVERAGQRRRDAVAEHEPHAARLATLEDSLGTDFQQLLDALELSERDLATAERALPPARTDVEERVEAEASARIEAESARGSVEDAEAKVVGHLDHLRAVLAVPGLPLAAWPTDGDTPVAAPQPDATADAVVGITDGPDAGLPIPPAVDRSSAGVAALAQWIAAQTPVPAHEVNAESVRMSLRQRRNSLGGGWDAEDRQPDGALPLAVEVNGPEGRFPLADAARVVSGRLEQQRSLLDAKQAQALRNLLQGLIAREIATKLHAARDLVALMNDRLRPVETAHGIRVSLQWRRRDDLDEQVGAMIDLLAKPPDLRTTEDDQQLIEEISRRIDDARADDPEAPYREIVSAVLDYRRWHQMRIMLHRPNQSPQRLGRRTALSEGEKKVVSYLPLFAAVAASCDALAEHEPSAPRFVLLDDAFAKVSADNHEKLFGLLVEMDLDFIATSERLWGTHATVPELAITEVIRDADAGVILLEHAHWNGNAIEGGRHG